MKMAVFWAVAPCCLVELLPDYTALQPEDSHHYIIYAYGSTCDFSGQYVHDVYIKKVILLFLIHCGKCIFIR
jgi:hypothetical protein